LDDGLEKNESHGIDPFIWERSAVKCSIPAAALPRVDSLLRPWVYQCPQGHQGPDGNVLVIHQLFLR
jgi:hypothetical protein